MEATGGTFELSDNLRGGTVVTLSVPGRAHQRAITLQLTEMARQLMALLLEMAPATPTTLARELAVSLGECGRELVLLEHRGLVERSEDGARSLTASGTQLLNTLF
jgi:DNA-binding MarR family transcriptional regulator